MTSYETGVIGEKLPARKVNVSATENLIEGNNQRD